MAAACKNDVLSSPETAEPRWFGLASADAYLRWRDAKLDRYPVDAGALSVEIADPFAPTLPERQKIADLCQKTNMAVYVARPGLSKNDALQLAGAFGLARLDIPLYTDEPGVTEITRVGAGRQGEYAPYTDRSLSWHTDGYYNKLGSQVRSMLLHCERPALEGGISSLLDPEIAYIRLRDENPEFISALMQPDALTIPANIEKGVMVRPAQSGPVFSIIGGALHMRFTARKRYVEWKPGAALELARTRLAEMLEDPGGPVIHHQLAAGEGLICNNVLHNRNAFVDPPPDGRHPNQRLLYRARFKDRVSV